MPGHSQEPPATNIDREVLAAERHYIGSRHWIKSKTLRELTRKLANREAGTLAEFNALPDAAKAYLAKTDEFKNFLTARAFDAALGNRELSKDEKFSMNWFRTEHKTIRDAAIKRKNEAQPILDVTSEGETGEAGAAH